MSAVTLTRPRQGRAVRGAVAIALAAGTIGIPFWLVVATSAKSQGQAQHPDLSLPTHW